MELSEIRELLEQAVVEGDWSLVTQAKNMLERYLEDRQYDECESDEDFID